VSTPAAAAAVDGGGERDRVAFVQEFVVVDRPYDDVVAHIGDNPRHLFEVALDAARRVDEHRQPGDDHLRISVGPERWPARLAKQVDLHLTSPRQVSDSTVISFSWQATGGASLFPDFDADLCIAPVGITQTQLQLQGRYHPPAGLLGRQADQLVLHRVAESTVRTLLTSIAAAIGPQRSP
jgi:hypothetical protein